MTALLSTTFFGPVQWYQKLCLYDDILIEADETYTKQTYRNRCVIATANGLQTLSVPIQRPALGFHATKIRDIRISDHGNWRHICWNALLSAYGESPFFEFYADYIYPFFERKWEFLLDFNMDICHEICSLLDINPDIKLTDSYYSGDRLIGKADLRTEINPKNHLGNPEYLPKKYHQVYEMNLGFLPNLSILDLIFNLGPEALIYLMESAKKDKTP